MSLLPYTRSKYSSLYTLILANLYPLFGVLFFSWNIQDILILYWLESGVIGFYNILKMFFAKGRDPFAKFHRNTLSFKIGKILFFMIHYGLFMFVHGVFIIALTSFPHFLIGQYNLPTILTFIIPILFLLVSHGNSFMTNFIGNGEYKKATPTMLLTQPYNRIVVMHVALVLGAFLVMSLGESIFIFILLIFGKTYLDIQAHLKERKRYATNI